MTMDIALAFDNNYIAQFYALITSIFCNHSRLSFSFHCIVRNLTEAQINEINFYVKTKGSSVHYYSIDEVLIQHFTTRSHWNTSVYYKIFFPLLLKGKLERFLYLDTDIIVANPLTSLYNLNLYHFCLAAVKDPFVSREPYWELHLKENYFNSGMMLINISEWNNHKISEKAIEYLNSSPEKIFYVDQDALNAVIDEGRVFTIDPKYNYTYSHLNREQSKAQLHELIKEIVIIHFTISRPWEFLCQNRLRYLYVYYLQKSPYKDKIIKDFTLSKVPKFLHIRVIELYHDSNAIKYFWRKIKSNLNLRKVKGYLS
jgi:lipopolysaccharide biosynthesis glycosyltransferase